MIMRDPPERWRRVAAAALLLIAVATQGVGLFFLAAALVEGWLRREGRGYLPGLCVVVFAYATWYLVYGRGGIDPAHPPLGIAAIQAVPAFVWQGFATAFGAATATGVDGGRVLSVAFTGAVLWIWLKGGSVRPLVIAALVGVAVEFVLIGLSRAHLGAAQASVSRYVYPAAVLVIIAVATALGPPLTSVAAKRRLVLVPLAAVVVLGGLGELRAGRDYMLAHARETRAVIDAVHQYGGRAEVSDERSLFPMPTVGRLRQILATSGDPSIPTGPQGFPMPTAAERDRALIRVVGAGLVPQHHKVGQVRRLSSRNIATSSSPIETTIA